MFVVRTPIVDQDKEFRDLGREFFLNLFRGQTASYY
jgi:hypothetical protein